MEATKAESPYTKPYLVLICDELGVSDELDRLEAETFGEEKVALGTRAFDCVRISPEDAERESLLKDSGKAIPRVVVLDPIRKTRKVLEKNNQLGPRPVYSAMKKIAAKFFENGKIDSLVRKNQKILAKLDKLGPEEFKLREDLDEAEEDGKRRKVEKIEKKLAKIADAKQKLLDEQTGLWSGLKAAALKDAA